jgi:large subunit ribosomal protein L18
MALSKRELFQKRRLRNRNKIKAMANGRPRLSVHRSNKNISVQLIDDANGVTLASASSLESSLGVVGKNNVEAAAKVGAAIAERAKKAGVEECYLRPGRLPVPWPCEGLGRCRTRRVAEVLRVGQGVATKTAKAGAASMIRGSVRPPGSNQPALRAPPD